MSIKPRRSFLVVLVSLASITFMMSAPRAQTAKEAPVPPPAASKEEDKPLKSGALYGIKYSEELIHETVYIPGSILPMGQPNANINCYQCSLDEQPVHRVEISSFEIGRFEVT